MLVFQDAFIGSVDLIRDHLSVDRDKFVYMKGPMSGALVLNLIFDN